MVWIEHWSPAPEIPLGIPCSALATRGTVYGYATDETVEKLPLPLVYAHTICRKLDSTMKNGVIKGIGPDGKAQVTVEYEDDTPKRIKTIVVSVQHRADKDLGFSAADHLSSAVAGIREVSI